MTNEQEKIILGDAITLVRDRVRSLCLTAVMLVSILLYMADLIGHVSLGVLAAVVIGLAAFFDDKVREPLRELYLELIQENMTEDLSPDAVEIQLKEENAKFEKFFAGSIGAK